MTDFPFAGTWQMVHDNWTGVLNLAVSPKAVTQSKPPCVFTTHRVTGTYTPSSGGPPMAVAGHVGGRDQYQRRHACPQSDHRITFTVAFPGADPQQFIGYFFTQAGPAQMAGLTWWQGIPFGWSAHQ
jgi:hypothetical protein